MESYVDKSRVSVRPIYKPLAKEMIEKYHYSHRLSSCRYPLGIFYQTDNEHKFFAEPEEKLIGVACYGFPVGRRVLGSIFSEEILENRNILELTRLFIHDGYGKNIESLALGLTFKWLKENGNISDDDMYRIFNCGIGMVLFVDEDEEINISSRIKELKMNSFVIGKVKNKKEESSVIFV